MHVTRAHPDEAQTRVAALNRAFPDASVAVDDDLVELPTTTAASPPPTANVIRLPRCDGLIDEYKNVA